MRKEKASEIEREREISRLERKRTDPEYEI